MGTEVHGIIYLFDISQIQKLNKRMDALLLKEDTVWTENDILRFFI